MFPSSHPSSKKPCSSSAQKHEDQFSTSLHLPPTCLDKNLEINNFPLPQQQNHQQTNSSLKPAELSLMITEINSLMLDKAKTSKNDKINKRIHRKSVSVNLKHVTTKGGSVTKLRRQTGDDLREFQEILGSVNLKDLTAVKEFTADSMLSNEAELGGPETDDSDRVCSSSG